jgi:hypothetical protein
VGPDGLVFSSSDPPGLAALFAAELVGFEVRIVDVRDGHIVVPTQQLAHSPQRNPVSEVAGGSGLVGRPGAGSALL